MRALTVLMALCFVAAGGEAVRAQGADAQPIPLKIGGNQYCRAQMPANWKVAADYGEGSVTLVSPDGHMAASYDLIPVNSGRVKGFYGPNFSTPDVLAEFLASEVAATDVDREGALQTYYGQRVLHFASTKGVSRNQSLGKITGVQGFEMYRAQVLAGDPGGYLFSARLASGQSAQEVAVAAAVAASIDCRAALKPSPAVYENAHPDAALGTSAACKAGTCDDRDIVGAYGAALGVGFAHSPSGALYLVDTRPAQPQQGLEGPGYYANIGGRPEKLEPGRM